MKKQMKVDHQCMADASKKFFSKANQGGFASGIHRMRTVKSGSFRLVDDDDVFKAAKVSDDERFVLYLLCGFITVGGYRQCVDLFKNYFGNEKVLLSCSPLFRANILRLRALATIRLYQRNILLGKEEEKKDSEILEEVDEYNDDAIELFEKLTETNNSGVASSQIIRLSFYGQALCQVQTSLIRLLQARSGQLTYENESWVISMLRQALENFKKISHLKGIEILLKTLLKIEKEDKIQALLEQ